MVVATHVPLEEYLRTAYRPDCDYVEGELIERNVGEYDHSRIQSALDRWFGGLEASLGIRAMPNLRVQVAPSRFRVPDICVTIGKPAEQYLTQPPFLCVEILSPEDRMQRMMDRISDYLQFGVPFVWVIDPGSRRAYVATSSGLRVAADGVLRTSDPDLSLNLEELLRAAAE